MQFFKLDSQGASCSQELCSSASSRQQSSSSNTEEKNSTKDSETEKANHSSAPEVAATSFFGWMRSSYRQVGAKSAQLKVSMRDLGVQARCICSFNEARNLLQVFSGDNKFTVQTDLL